MVYDQFKIVKPAHWESLAMYQKIAYYGTQLNADYAKYIDKLQAKQIVKDLCSDEIKIAPIRKLLKGPHDITKDDLISHTLIKSAHGSGWNIIVSDSVKDVHAIRHQLSLWNRIYSTYEKQYTFLTPTFFIEDVIDDKYYGKNGQAVVYMIRCIYGKVVSISPYLKDNDNISNYDINWQIFYHNDIPHISKPVQYDKMIKYAKILAAPFEFVRIDFYIDKHDDIYFSEFTFTPKAGAMCYSHDVEKKMGDLWT